MDEDILNLIRRLPRDEQIELRDTLSAMINEGIMGIRPGMEDIMPVLTDIEDICGAPIYTRNRIRESVLARRLAAYYLCCMGITTQDAGKILNKRHSTIIHHRDQMVTALAHPRAYKEWVLAWRELIKRHPL